MGLRNRISPSALFAACSIFLIVWPIAGAVTASADTLSVSDTIPPTHRAFVDSSLRDLARRALAGFTPNRSRPLAILPDSSGDTTGVFSRALAGTLSQRGLLIRDNGAAVDSADLWVLHYTVAPRELTLTEPHRRSFLGRIWVKRTLHAGADLRVHDLSDSAEVWSGHVDTTYFDWVAKRDLKHLADAEYAPRAPSTGWEKVQWPLVAGGAAAVIGILVLALR